MWHIICMTQCFIFSVWHYIFMMTLHQHDTFHLQRSTLRLHAMSFHQHDNFDDIASSWCNWIDVNLIARVQRTWERGLTCHVVCSVQHHIFTIWCCFAPSTHPQGICIQNGDWWATILLWRPWDKSGARRLVHYCWLPPMWRTGTILLS